LHFPTGRPLRDHRKPERRHQPDIGIPSASARAPKKTARNQPTKNQYPAEKAGTPAAIESLRNQRPVSSMHKEIQ
jgi:hypothetical protein